MKLIKLFLLLVLFSYGYTPAYAAVYYFNNAVNTSPSELGNYWNDSLFTSPATQLPNFTVDEVYINTNSTFDNLNVPAYNPIIFNGNATNDGTITGDAIFRGDNSENNATVAGTKTRYYTTPLTTNRNFNDWTIVADGALIDVSTVVFDSNAVYSEINGGNFIHTRLLSLSAINSAIMLQYDKNLDNGSVPDTTDYIVTINGVSVTILNVNVVNKRVTLTLPFSPSINSTVLLTYIPGVNPIQVGPTKHADGFNTINVSVYSPTFLSVGTTPLYSTLVGTKLYVSNGGDNTISVVDTTTDIVINTINLSFGPSFLVNIGKKLYVHGSSPGENLVAVIDTTNDTIITNITVGDAPYFSAVIGTKLYVNNFNDTLVSIIDTRTDTVIDSLATGLEHEFSFSIGNKLYVANAASDTISVIDTDTNTILQQISVDDGNEPSFITGIGTKLYVLNRGNASISVINSVTDTITTTISTGQQTPFFTRIVGTKLYVNNFGSNSVSVIDTNTNTILKTILVGDNPSLSTAFQNKLYIYNNTSNTVSVIDTTTDTVVDTLILGDTPYNGTIVGTKLYVGSSDGNIVSVIDTTEIPSLLPNLVSFSTTTASGVYTTGEIIPITAHFGRALLGGSTMTIQMNNGASVILNQVSGATLSGTYTVGANQSTPDLAVTSITSANVSDLNGHTRTTYQLPISQGTLLAENSFITRNLGDSKNIQIGNYDTALTGLNPYQISVPINGYLYVANQGAGTVSVIKESDRTLFTTIPVGLEPYGLTLSNNHLYVANTGSDTVSVINPSTNTVVATIPVGVKPYYAEHIDTTVYVTNGASNTVSVINALTNTVVATIPVGSYPRGIKAHGTDLYVANYGDPNYSGGNYISVINSLNNTVTATILNPAGSFGPRGVTVLGSKVYVTNYLTHSISVIDTATNTITATIPVGKGPRGIVGLGTTLYVENFDDGTLSMINTNTNTVTSTIAVGSSPSGMSISGTDIYISAFQDDKLYVLDTLTNTLRTTQPTITPVPNTPVVSSSSGGTITSFAPPVVAQQTLQSTPTQPKFMFTRNLSLNTVNSDVKILQQFLNKNGFPIAKSGPGSVGKETTIFGLLTQKSVIAFQKKHAIYPSIGYFGPLTRSKVNDLIQQGK